MLRRFWIEFGDSPATSLPVGATAGCGVTARDRADALDILATLMFAGVDVPPVRRIEEDVKMEDLDPKHVVPNMANPFARGIWYPLGYG